MRPQLGEAPFLGHDFPLTVHDEDAVGGGNSSVDWSSETASASAPGGAAVAAPRVRASSSGGLSAPFGHG